MWLLYGLNPLGTICNTLNMWLLYELSPLGTICNPWFSLLQSTVTKFVHTDMLNQLLLVCPYDRKRQRWSCIE